VTSDRNIRRLGIEIRGAVQGVGFRPYVYRLAHELELPGWVLNDSRGVFIEVEGPKATLDTFLHRLPAEKPPRAVIHSLEMSWLAAEGFEAFEIRHSAEEGTKSVAMLPDIATCPDCLAEVLDKGDRRFRYPFTNCTNCGPRFTIIEALPYDRPNTTMRDFVMCPECSGEYTEPMDRRFHAQPNACPACGPQLALWDKEGNTQATGDFALRQAAAALRRGEVLAVKGLGGFHLMVDSRSATAVAHLRQRKARYEKPLALMVRDVEEARRICRVSADEEALLESPESPIVLLERLPSGSVAQEVAPDNPRLGLMLPYTPLHHLLLGELSFPVVATSGNLSDEPICIDNAEALERLGEIADLLLVHDRPIQRHVDDSVVSLVAAKAQPIRRARGLAPMPLVTPRPLPTLLAVGAHLKNTVALSVGDKIFLSQHIGDMETPQAFAAFEAVARDFLDMYEAEPMAIVNDLHPDYPSTRWVERAVEGATHPAADDDWKQLLVGKPTFAVQHHHAHLAACLMEQEVEGRALGVTWDGTGYGTDGTVWGGEFLLGDTASFSRVCRLRPFHLPGGDAAVKQPRRCGLALLWEMLGDEALDRSDLIPVKAFDEAELRLLGHMLASKLNSPRTTSAGRLFDAVASLLGIQQRVSFEGQAAMAVEWIADKDHMASYPVIVATPSAEREPFAPAPEDREEILEIEWQPMVEAMVEDSRRGVDVGIIAARFHNALVEAILAVAKAVGEPKVALTGGCFQNRLLTERASQRLREAGFDVLLHRQVPPNDGGISLGQIAVAAARMERQDSVD
jgi:hydrogenase maturation protein HypF